MRLKAFKCLHLTTLNNDFKSIMILCIFLIIGLTIFVPPVRLWIGLFVGAFILIASTSAGSLNDYDD